MNKVITRFAPSPTGKLHIGNARTALINWLFTKKYNGMFILRMDNTDLVRSKDEYETDIMQDLQWLGIHWDNILNQRSRLTHYNIVKQHLISKGRLYPCYETPEEIDQKRKLLLSKGLPPIYDRAALCLTEQQIRQYHSQGRKPYYRFLMRNTQIHWTDMIKGDIKYQGANISDPVVIREDGQMTYILSSTIDDMEYKVSHIIRGEDHVSNTAIQIQIFEAMNAIAPVFGHLSLMKSQNAKISKREGGFEISYLRDILNIEPIAINSFLGQIGSSNNIQPYNKIQDLINTFDICHFSKSPTTYIQKELELLNQKIVREYTYSDITHYLQDNNLNHINEKFWLLIKHNISKLSDIRYWWDTCYELKKMNNSDQELLLIAAKYLPEQITNRTWQDWINQITIHSGKKGKELFMPLRLALTGKTTGPELNNLFTLLSRDEIIKRLTS